MNTFLSKDPQGSVSFEKTGDKGVGSSQSSEFKIRVSSLGFDITLSNVVFDSDELRLFGEQVRDLIGVKADLVILRALANFTVEIMPKDQVGHFLIRFSLENPAHGNIATVSAVFDAGTLSNFAEVINTRLAA